MSNKSRAIVIAFSLLLMLMGISINSIVTFLSGLGYVLLVSIDSMEERKNDAGKSKTDCSRLF